MAAVDSTTTAAGRPAAGSPVTTSPTPSWTASTLSTSRGSRSRFRRPRPPPHGWRRGVRAIGARSSRLRSTIGRRCSRTLASSRRPPTRRRRLRLLGGVRARLRGRHAERGSTGGGATLGAEGAVAFVAGEEIRIAAPPVESVDASGAGDALAASTRGASRGRPGRASTHARRRRRDPFLPVVRRRALLSRRGRARSPGSVVNMIEELARQRILPVLRCRDAEDTIATARATAAAGCRVVEVTLSTPGAEDAIAPLVAEGLLVAVGTVQDASARAEARRRRRPPGRLLLEPAGIRRRGGRRGHSGDPRRLHDPRARRRSRRRRRRGEALPRRTCRPSFLVALQPLLPDLRLLVTGGIEPDGVRPWLDAGALAVGLGSRLGTAATVGADEVERRCRIALAAAS